MIFLDMGLCALPGAAFASSDLLRHLIVHSRPSIILRDVIEYRILGLVTVVVELRDNPSPFRLCLVNSLPLCLLLSPESSVLQLECARHPGDFSLEGLASNESL